MAKLHTVKYTGFICCRKSLASTFNFFPKIYFLNKSKLPITGTIYLATQKSSMICAYFLCSIKIK